MHTQREIADLRLMGCAVDSWSVSAYSVAHILGIHFRAGEWGKEGVRYGSVVTCVIEGRSLYACVHRFLKVDNDDCPGYASVSWFSVPEYPLCTPLIVCVKADGRAIDTEHGSIVKITAVVPNTSFDDFDIP